MCPLFLSRRFFRDNSAPELLPTILVELIYYLLVAQEVTRIYGDSSLDM
jgi:hypothetical protein